MQILYTDTSQVRGCLFVEAEDLPDALFNSTLLERELLLDLDSWLPDHATRVAANTTTQEKRIANLIKSYVTYWLAEYLIPSLPVSLPQKVADGKNSRELGTDQEMLRVSITSRVGALRQELLSLTSSQVATRLRMFSAVGLAVDPVTSSGA